LHLFFLRLHQDLLKYSLAIMLLILTDCELSANLYHHQVAYHFHKILEKGTAKYYFQKFISN